MQADKHPVLFYCIVSASAFVALWLLILPLPFPAYYFRPEWGCLLLVYWVLSNPNHIGFGFAFIFGLLQDILEQNIWGANALGLVLVAYVCAAAHRRVQSYSVWQQSLWVLVLVGLYQLTANAVMRLEGTEIYLEKQIPALTVSAMCWPLLLFLAGFLKRRFGMM
jgi:rod shape-determining protein MreD